MVLLARPDFSFIHIVFSGLVWNKFIKTVLTRDKGYVRTTWFIQDRTRSCSNHWTKVGGGIILGTRNRKERGAEATTKRAIVIVVVDCLARCNAIFQPVGIYITK